MGVSVKIDSHCTGCNQCLSVCPNNAIELIVTKEGFWYPSINDNCIHCGKCIAKCPVYGGNPDGFHKPKSYAAWNQDDFIHLKSSSGGIFSLLAENVLNSGGYVYGAAYDSNMKVNHIRVDNISDLDRLRGSKYVQSFISVNIYKSIKEDLMTGKFVLFSGTPCQVAAVNKLYGKNDNLLTVDVICHGVPSPKAWEKYLDELTKKNGPIYKVDMRNKEPHGWNKYHMTIYFNSGKCDDSWFNDNLWGKSFVNNLFLRTCCYECQFKKYVRCSDITLGDFWEAARGEHTEFDDSDKGTSVVLVNSKKGERQFEKLDCHAEEISYDLIPRCTYAVLKSSKNNENRDKAFTELDSQKFSTIVQKYTRIKRIAKLRNIIQRVIKESFENENGRHT